MGLTCEYPKKFYDKDEKKNYRCGIVDCLSNFQLSSDNKNRNGRRKKITQKITSKNNWITHCQFSTTLTGQCGIRILKNSLQLRIIMDRMEKTKKTSTLAYSVR